MSTITSPTSSFSPQVSHRRAGRRAAKPLAFNRQIEIRAAELLELHPHFRGRGRFVRFTCDGNCLTLGGCLPSYYLKQLAQEAIREIDEVEIVNQIMVTGMVGRVVPPDPNSDANSIKRIPR